MCWRPPMRALEQGGAVARRPPRGTRWWWRVGRPRRGSTWRSRRAAGSASRWSSPERVWTDGTEVREAEGVRFVGRVEDARLAELRAGAALAVVPSRSAETFGLAAAEAMAAGLPVAGSRVGALPELLEEEGMAPPGDARALAEAIERVRGDPGAGERALERVRAMCAPEVVAGRLAEVYEAATAW